MSYDPEYNHLKFHPPEDAVLEKLELSDSEVDCMDERKIKCPICGHSIYSVYGCAIGHIKIKCNYCKFSGVINLSYFRTQKKSNRYFYWKNENIIKE